MGTLYAGLDVADRTTAICIIDADGQIVFEGVAETTPDAIASALKPYRRRLAAVGQEIGTKAAWLHRGLERAKYPIRSLDARHAHAALKAQLNKTDANDARGLAVLLARGLYTTAFIKSDEAIRVRIALGIREALICKVADLSLTVRAAQKQVGEFDLPPPRRGKNVSEGELAMRIALESVARTQQTLASEIAALDSVVRDLAKESDLCRRLMALPGVGELTALSFTVAIDDPFRFESSRDVAAYLGLTPRTFQSGGVSRSGGISHRGDRTIRKLLFLAGRSLLSNSRSTWRVRQWGLRIKETKGGKLAYVAVARKYAVLMHHLWVTGQDFDPSR